jgi:Avidin family
MSIEGVWYNELGSKMVIKLDDDSITGEYQTSVGDAGGIYDLVGSIDVDGDPTAAGQAIAWVVVWNNEAHGSSHSITAWSGQYQVADGEETIITLWLLTGETPPDADWSATRVNQDLFTRTQPTAKSIMTAQRRNQVPHPFNLGSEPRK